MFHVEHCERVLPNFVQDVDVSAYRVDSANVDHALTSTGIEDNAPAKLAEGLTLSY